MSEDPSHNADKSKTWRASLRRTKTRALRRDGEEDRADGSETRARREGEGMIARQWGRAVTKWTAIAILAGGFGFMLLAAAYGYLWGANPWALPIIVMIGMIPPGAIAFAIFSIGWAVFADSPEA